MQVQNYHILQQKSQKPTFITIEQIYEVDTITLEELIEQFQNQPFYQALNFPDDKKDFGTVRVSPQFFHLSTKQLKKWYQLAKMQLVERKKIEEFALKLIEEQIQSPNMQIQSSQYQSHLPIKVKDNPKVDDLVNEMSLKSLTDILSKKQSIGVTLPPINNHSKIHDRKIEQNNQTFNNPSSNQFNKQTKKSETFQTSTKTDTKVLSKKEFLQMMKIKLNQGKDYKTASFIKEQTKPIQNVSSKKLTVQNKHDKTTSKPFFGEKNKSKSVYSIGKVANTNIHNSYVKGVSNASTLSVGSFNKLKTERPPSRYTYTSRKQTKVKDELKTIHNAGLDDEKKQKDSSLASNQIKNINPQIFPVTNEFLQPEKKDVVAETINSQQVTRMKVQQIPKKQNTMISQKMEIVVAVQDKKNNVLHVFAENEDAYDDQPQVFQKVIILQKQQLFSEVQEDVQLIQKHFPSQEIQTTQIKQSEQNQSKESHEQRGGKVQETSTYPKNNFHSNVFSNQQNFHEQNNCVQKSEEQKIYNKSNIIQKSHPQKIQPDTPQVKQNQSQLQRKNTQNRIKSRQSTLEFRERILSPVVVQKYPPYHLIFPTFNHLFNHPKSDSALPNNQKFSIPSILKQLQLSLQSFFKKQVTQIAKGHQANKMAFDNFNEGNAQNLHKKYQNLEIKCITLLQFLGSSDGNSLFDLDLQSFKQKSMNLIRKLRGQSMVSFQNQKYMLKKQTNNDLKQKQDEFLFYRVVRNKPEVYDIINTSFYRKENWLQLPHGMELQGCWNLLWTWSKPQIDFNSLIKFQKVNHFPGSKELARKDLLKKNIEKIKKLSKKLAEYFDIIPDTYFLPGQNMAFIKKFRESERQNRNMWILKPVGLSRGRGISLITKLEEVIFSQPIVMQKYIHNPFLLDGYKFDLRIYVLVTSINPLQCFIYKEGFARVSTERYCNDLEQKDNKFVHLTNYSIQKDSMKCPGMFTSREKKLGGCKLTLKMLRDRLQKKGVIWQSIWDEIEQVVLKSLISCMKYIPKNPNCFQLFGYDIMLDSSMKCWLIEVNSSPSLEQDFIIDEILKQQLVDDTIEIVDPLQFNREELLKVIKRRRRQEEGFKSHVSYTNNSVEQLNEDLFKICNGKIFRNYGQVKQHKNFKCIAPGVNYQKILKTVQHYTHDPFVKSTNFY